jgi:hypothetical protein
MNPAERAIRKEIERRESEIAALKKALAALTGIAVGMGKGNRKPKTEAQKKALSAALKAAWKKRKAEKKKPA